MKNLKPVHLCIFLCTLVILGACNNVFNRDANLVYQGQKQEFQADVCPDASLFEKESQRLLTQQKVSLAKNSQLVLEHVIPVLQPQLFLELIPQSGQSQASQADLYILQCRKHKDADSFQFVEGFSVDTSKTVELSLDGFKGQQLMLVLYNQGKAKQFILDVKYSADEGQPWPISDKQSKQQAVSGFVDLHLHQTGAMAFNQGWYWGSHEVGSLEAMLPDCQGEHASMFEYEHVLDGKITGPIAYAVAPKNDVDDFMRAHRHMTEAKDYVRSDDRKHQQVAYERLKEAHARGLNLIISTVVENNVLLDIMYAAGKGRKDWYPSVMESIKRQIHSLHEIDKQSDWFEIVYDPWHARRAINEGKLAVVLGAEFTDIFPLSDGPWKQQLYDLYAMGLRHLQPVHKSDSQFSSTHNQGFPFDNTNLLRALIRKEIPNYPAIQRSLGQDDPSTGLSESGFELLDEMVRLHMIIDLSHASLASQREMSDYLLEQKHYYPFIYSHWSAREAQLLDKVKLAGGMIAFGWGQPVPDLEKDTTLASKVACKDFVKTRAELYQRYIDYGINFSLASDMNGFTSTTQPNFGPRYCQLSELQKNRSDQDQTWENMKAEYPQHPDWVNRYWAQGTADISLLPGIVYDLRNILGMDTTKIDQSTESFIKMWERTYQPDRQKVAN